MGALLRRLVRQLPRVMAPTTVLFARLQVPAGMHVLAGGGKVLGYSPSASAAQFVNTQVPVGLHVLARGGRALGYTPSAAAQLTTQVPAGLQVVAGGGRVSYNPSSSSLQLVSCQVRARQSAQLMIRRQCNTATDNEQNYTKLVKNLAEAVEKNKLDTRYFHSIVIILLGALVAATGSLTMKINKTDQENSAMSAELEKEKVKVENLSKEVEVLTARASMAKTSVPTDTPKATSSTATDGSTTNSLSTSPPA